MKKYKTGLVLSGGGTRGFAHLGVVAALYERGIKPEIISGVSAGAITGAFIAAGKSPEETMAIFKKGWFFRYTKIQLPINGLFRLDGLKEVIENEIEVKNIEDLKIPFFIGASNLNNGSIEYVNKGPLSDWVLASSSIPVLFSPVKINSTLYADGGIVDNVPVKPIKEDCEQIIIVNISPINKKENLKNLPQIAIRTLYMSVNATVKDLNNEATIYIEPKGIDKYEILNRSHADELFELGYNAAKNVTIIK
jgi:NTE family protein